MAIVTTKVGYGERLGNSFKGIIGGILLVIIGIGLLFWNEGRTIHTRAALNEGADSVVSISSLDTANDGMLVHYSDIAMSSNNLELAKLGIVEEDGLKLKISREVLQWKEVTKTTTKDNLGGSETKTTEYTYKKEWSKNKVDSSNFEGPEAFEYTNTYLGLESLGLEEVTQVDNIMIGEFEISNSLLGYLSDYAAYAPNENITKNVKGITTKTLSGVFNTIAQKGQYIYLTQGEGENIGDARMMLEIIEDQDVSIIGNQEGNMLGEFKASNGIEISQLSQGKFSAVEMFDKAKAGNEAMKWILRVLSFFLIFGGFKAILNPLVILAKVVPFISSIIGFGTGLISGVLAIIVYTVVTFIAWIRFSPIFAIGILAIGLVIVGGLLWKKKKKGLNTVPDTEEKKEETEVVEA